MPDLFQIEGLPQKRSVWAIPNWPESLAGMTACCGLKPDNEVHMGGPDGRDGAVAASAMDQCVRNKGNLTGPYITIWQVKEGAAAAVATTWSGKMSLKTVAWGLVVVGLLA
ncbi:hypothetical protein N0V85_009716 [Neurospora sp. IMI 360204]|nr:hypothetical protein N0V85_009716 [Neurospora sp. IMI 360204]